MHLVGFIKRIRLYGILEARIVFAVDIKVIVCALQ